MARTEVLTCLTILTRLYIRAYHTTNFFISSTCIDDNIMSKKDF